MDKYVKKKKENSEVTGVTTFQVPSYTEAMKGSISISTSKPNNHLRKEIVNKALHFHAKGNISEAAKYYQYFLDKGFNDPIVFSNYGMILKNFGKLEKAEIYLRKSIALKPDFANAYSNLGTILKELNKSEEAEIAYRKAIELKPDFANAYYNLGNILKIIGKLEEAELYLRKAIEIKPKFANAYSNLGNILNDLGKLKEAEVSLRKAIELKPDLAEAYSNLGELVKELGRLKEAESLQIKAIKINPTIKTLKNNLINLLTIYKPKDINANPLYMINEDFKRISLNIKENNLITDHEAVKIYQDGLEIYKNYNLDLETNLSQIYKRNDLNLNCKRHKLIFEKHKIIPEFCFGCYKVQVDLISIVELIKLSLVLNNLKLKNNNTRKTMIELRNNIPGFYKGLIYCLSLEEAFEISNMLNIKIKKNIRSDLKSTVKRGCSEYSLEFPKYKEIRVSEDQPMNYNKSWKKIEEEIDKEKKEWGKSFANIEGFSLDSFLIIRNWIVYAQKLGDPSVNKLTKEIIKPPEWIINLISSRTKLKSKLN